MCFVLLCLSWNITKSRPRRLIKKKKLKYVKIFSKKKRHSVLRHRPQFEHRLRVVFVTRSILPRGNREISICMLNFIGKTRSRLNEKINVNSKNEKERPRWKLRSRGGRFRSPLGARRTRGTRWVRRRAFPVNVHDTFPRSTCTSGRRVGGE